MNHRLLCLACAAAFLLTACINEADYPSLDVRPIEKRPVAEEQSVSTGVDDSALSPELQASVAAAEAGDARFRSDLALAAKAVAAAGDATPESEAWVAAQQALSRAQASRVPVADALAALDEAETGPQRPASPALVAAIDRLTALNARQSAAMDTLTDRLLAR